jgi:S1-C subfamily serine protease
MKSVMLSVLLLLTLACSTAHSKVPPAVNTSVFVLKVNEQSVCTAFSVEDSKHNKRLVSAGHCVDDIVSTDKVAAYHPTLGSYQVNLLMFQDNWPDGQDYSVFEFTQSAPAFALTVRAIPEIGDETWVMMAPLGINPFLAPGYFSGVASCSEGPKKCEIDGMYLVSMPIGSGGSGGPVMDARGRVFGIAVGSNFQIPGMAVVAPLPKL